MSLENLLFTYSNKEGAYESVHLQGLTSATCGAR